MLSAVTILALALAAQAAPAPVPATEAVQAVQVTGAKTFTAPAVKNPAFVRNGTAALLKAYAKHNLTPTGKLSASFLSELSALKQKRQDSSVPATDYQNVEYLVSTVVGGQTLNLDFDTGSADL